MQLALKEAQEAASEGEVPVGTLIVVGDGQIVGKAHNQVERLKDATAHAEMIALTQASSALEDWRLENCTMYVTLEPCAMCSGAIVQTRIGTVVFGTRDWSQGGLLSNFGITQHKERVHKIEIIEGILEEECKEILNNFFKKIRNNVGQASRLL